LRLRSALVLQGRRRWNRAVFIAGPRDIPRAALLGSVLWARIVAVKSICLRAFAGDIHPKSVVDNGAEVISIRRIERIAA